MIGAPVVVQVLKGVDAVAKNRKIMGATNPKEADKGTIRADLSEDIEANTVHGSDSIEAATQEVKFFFSEIEILR
jgi:nucleoside-diphosphate kinase